MTKPGTIWDELLGALAGSWRRTPPPFDLSAQALDEMSLPLLETGTASLAWWRVRQSPVRNSASASKLRQNYRVQSREALRHESDIQRLVATLRSASIEPVLIKGWAAARHYAEAGLRPFGDIDVCVAPAQLPDACKRLGHSLEWRGLVDLHEGVPDLPDRTWNQVLQRSRLVPLEDTLIRILGPEDHLRLLCVHFVRHGGMSVRSLCDVAAALESASADFDWQYCLSGGQGTSQWILAVAGLAVRLLGANLSNPAIAAESLHVRPRWLKKAVLRQWDASRAPGTLLHYLAHPIEAAERLDRENLNPITASFRLGLLPRTVVALPCIQLVALVSRTIPRLLRLLLRKHRKQAFRPFEVHRGRRFLGGCFDLFTERRLRRLPAEQDQHVNSGTC